MTTRLSPAKKRRSWRFGSLRRFARRLARHFRSSRALPTRRAAARLRFLRVEPLEERSLLSLAGLKSIGPTGDFSSITNAIGAIDNQGLSGPLILELQATYQSTVEPTGSPIAFASLPTTATNTVTIRPAAGANVVISSSDLMATISIDLTSYVTIDGRAGGVGTANNLTIENTGTSGAAIQFIDDSTNNLIEYTSLKAANTNAAADPAHSITSGVVYFGVSAGAGGSGHGNDNNTIDHCDIADGAAGTPLYGVYSAGTSGLENDHNTLSNDNIFNFFSPTGTPAAGVRLDASTTDWTISGNSFYQSASRTGAGQIDRAIYLNNTSGNGFVVTNNLIGGNAANATGTWTTAGGSSYKFVGIQLNVGTTTPSSVQGNTIKNFTWVTSSANTSAPGVWSGIYVQAGSANIGTTVGNTIGSDQGTGSISVTTGSAATAVTYGIASDSNAVVAISNNTIGSITTNGTTAITSSIVGIQVVSAATNTISGNTIGSTTTANSLNAIGAYNSSNSGQQVTGIFNSGTGTGVTAISNNTVANLNNNYAGTNTAGQIRGIVAMGGANTITGNTVRNLSTASQNIGSGTMQSVLGIVQASTVVSGQTVSQNTITALSNTTATSAPVFVTGIYYNGAASGTNTIARNFINGLSIANTNTVSTINGMQLVSGNFTAQNNMVRLGIDAGGANTATAATIRGIYDNSSTGTRNYYFNSVYVGGSQTSGASPTSALLSEGSTNTRTIENNILDNARTRSGTATGNNYAVQFTTTGLTGLTIDYNDYFATGTGGNVGRFGASDKLALSDWKTATGQDAHSLSVDPLFVDPTGSIPNLHVQNASPANAAGVAIVAVTDDFDGELRSNLTPVDIGADAFSPGTVQPTLDGSGNLTIADNDATGKNNNLTVSVSGNALVITEANEPFPSTANTLGVLSNNNQTLTIANFNSVITGALIFNTGGGSDLLTVDFSGGNPIPAGGITYNAGESAADDDRLKLTGYNLTTADGTADVIVNHSGPEAGNVVLAGLGTVSFTQAEPLALAGTAADLVINLPAGPNIDTTLGDDGVVDFNDSTNDANTSAIYDSTSPRSFEYTEFTNPTNSLKITPGSASDNLAVLSLVDSGLDANLTIGSVVNAFSSVSFQGNVTLTGTHGLAVTTAKNISVSASATIAAAGGDISLSANRQMTPSTGSFVGVDIDGGVLKTTTGNITVAGTGGTTGDQQIGVWVHDSGAIGGDTLGKVTVMGWGGATSGNGYNVGVAVDSFGSKITSGGGNVEVSGTGGSSSTVTAGNNFGVDFQGSISATNLGTLTITGTGATAPAGSGNAGLNLAGSAQAGTGPMILTGTGDSGVQFSGVIATGGDINVTGTAMASGGFGIAVTGNMNTFGSGNIQLTADTMNLQSNIGAETRAVTLLPKTPGQEIDLGAPDSGTQLGLSGTELGASVITAGTINIGDGNSGPITVSADIRPKSGTVINLASDGAISFSSGLINTGDGNLTLAPGASAATTFAKAGTDAIVGAGTLSFASGSKSSFAINGTAPDSGFDVLNVTGNIDLTGTDLTVTGGYHPVAGDKFAIVTYTGTRTGLFASSTVTLGGVSLNVVYDDAHNQIYLAAPNLGTLSASVDGSGNLTIADADGTKDNNLTVSTNSGSLIISDPNEAFISAPTGGVLSNSNKTLTFADFNTVVTGSLTINAAGGNDGITLTSALQFTGGITINGGPGNDSINLNSSLSLASGNSLNVDLQDDDPSPGTDTINVGSNAAIVLSGNGAATLRASKSIAFASGTSLTTASGDITIEANQQTTPTSGSFVGVTIDGASVASSGGNVTVLGLGGDTGPNQYGVEIENPGAQVSGGSGAVTTIVGTGGATTDTTNYGVYVQQSAVVTSAGGNVQVTGFGGGAGTSSNNHGVAVVGGSAKITAGGSGTVTVQGTGGSGAGSYGLEVNAATITSGGGTVSVTGTGGAGGSGAFFLRGIDLNSFGVISAGGTGSLTVAGTGGNGPGGGNYGVDFLGNSAQITSNGGPISVTGVGSNASFGLLLSSNSFINSTNNAAVTLIADSMSFDTSGTAIVSAGTGTVNLRPNTNGTLVDLGGSDVFSPNPLTLGLTDSELDQVTAGTIVIGGNGSATYPGNPTGTITVSSDITRAASANLVLISSGDVVLSGGQVNTDGGTLLLHPGATPSAVKPTHAGADATASMVSFGSDLAINIAGTTVDTDYDQLNVSGTVDLTGVNLVLTGSFVPGNGQSFAIVSAISRTGFFSNLPTEGSMILFNGKTLVAHYTSTGVVLGVQNAAISGGNLVLDVGSGRTDDITIVVAGNNYLISDPTSSNTFFTTISGATGNFTNSLTVPINVVTGQIQFLTGDQNDRLTVDFSGGDFANSISYDGGTQSSTPGDRLKLTGGTFATVTHSFTGSGAGSITLDSNSISYTGLEPVDLSNIGVGDLSFTLPSTASTAFLEDDGTTTNSISQIRSSGGAFETTTFANPTGSLTINRGNAADNLIISALPDFTAGLTIGAAGSEFSAVTFAGSMTLAANKSLVVNATDTISLPNANSDLAASGTGTITLTTARDISLSAGSSLSTASGSISLTANSSGATTSSFVGIKIDQGTITSTGGGVSLNGHGGTSGGAGIDITGDPGSSSFGVPDTAVIEGGGSGTATSVIAVGGGGAAGNYGLIMQYGATISSAAGSNGTVVVSGTATGGSGGSNAGILSERATKITAGGSGAVQVTGVAGNGTASDHGVWLQTNGLISSGGGPLTITGTAGAGTSSFGIESLFASQITTGGNATLTLVADSMDFSSDAVVSAGNGTANLRQKTIDVAINLGGNDATGTLGLNDPELDRVTAGVLRVGDVNSGPISISSSIGRHAGFSTLSLVTGDTSSSAVSQAAALSVANLAVQSTGTVLLSNAGNDVDKLAASVAGLGHDFAYTDATGFVLSTVDGVSGIQTGTGGVGESIFLTAGGSVNQDSGASVGSNNLVLLGSATYSLDDPANNVDVLAANINGSLTYTDTNILDIGAVSGTSGIATVDGSVNIATVNGPLTVRSAGSINAGSSTVNLTAGTTSTLDKLLTVNGTIAATGGVTLIADNMTIGAAIAAGSSTVALKPTSNGVQIDIGGNDTVGILGLTNPELDFITAGTIVIGSDGSATYPGNPTGAITVSNPIAQSHDANITVVTAQNIAVNAGWTSTNGNLTFSANQQTMPIGGNFVGISVNGAAISSTGGNVTLLGRGGDTGGRNAGVEVSNGGSISGGDSGKTTSITGTGGTGGAGSTLGYDGIRIIGSGSTVTSSGGNVHLTGFGGSSEGPGTGDGNFGIWLVPGNTISAGGSGNVQIDGTGGTNPVGYNHGVEIEGLVTAAGGDVSIAGSASQTGDSSYDQHGVRIVLGGQVTGASGHAVTVTGTSENGPFDSGLVVFSAGISASSGGQINLIADSMDLGTQASATIDAGSSGTVSLQQKTNGTLIDLGGSDVVTGSVPITLGLTETEINSITAGTINIGNSNSGAITISDSIARNAGSTAAINLTTASGNNITFGASGSLDAKNGNVTLLTNSSGSGGILSGGLATDVFSASLSLAAGSGGIGAAGNPLVFSATNLNATTGGNANQFLSVSGGGSTTIDSTGLSAGSGTIEFDGGTFTLGGSNRVNDSTNLNINGGTFDIGANNETVAGVTLTTGSITGTGGTLTSTTTFQTQSGSISAILAGSVGLTQNAAGTTTLSGANTYSGNTTITNGTLMLGAANAIPNGSGLGNVILNPPAGTATLDLGGFNETVDGLMSSGLGSSVVDNSGTSVATLKIGDNSVNSDYAGVIKNSGGALSIEKIGTGILTLTGTNAYSGTTTVSQGILTAGGGSAIPDTSDVYVFPTWTFRISASETIGALNGIGIVTNLASATLTVTNGGDYGGQIVNGTGTLGLIVNGINKTLTLDGTNTYTGNTTVVAGTLDVDGSITSNVTVKSSGILGGFLGTINSSNTVTVENGGELTPGFKGPLQSGSVSLSSGAIFSVLVVGFADHSQLNVMGTVNLAGATLDYGSSGPILGSQYVLIDNDGTDAISGTFNGYAEGKVFTIAGHAVQISYQGGDGNDVVLTAVDNANPVLQGTPGDDTWLVKRNADNTHLDISLNGALVDSPVYADLTSLSINGLAGNDTLTVDDSLGSAIPGSGINFDGGTSTTADKLILTGGTQSSVAYNYTDNQTGSITSNFGTINFSNTEQLADTNTGTGTITEITVNLHAIIASLNAVTLAGDGTTSNKLSRLTASTIPQTDFANPTGSLTINRGSSADTITINDVPDFTAALQIGAAGSEFAAVTFAGALTLAANKNLSANAIGTISLPNTTSNLAVSGTGAVTLTTAQNISLANGASITAVNGNITLSANQQTTPTSGTFVGVDISSFTPSLQVTGSGVISIAGKGGDGTGITSEYGVYVGGGISGGTGGVSITGNGGGAGSSLASYGVYVDGSAITAAGTGPITVQGAGGASAGLSNYGVFLLASGASIVSSGGDVQVTGHGGGSGAAQSGVGIIDQGGQITAGGTGSLTIQGFGGPGTGSTNYGVELLGSSALLSAGGTVNITGVEGGGDSGLAFTTNGGTVSSPSSVTLIADSINLFGSPTISGGSGGSVSVHPFTAGKDISLGPTTDTVGSGSLALSDAELDTLTAGTINIGDANSGSIGLTTAIDRAAGSTTAINLTAGAGNISLGGGFDAKNGSVTLLTNASGSGAIISGTATVDITAANVSLTAGNGGIGQSADPVVVAATNLNTSTPNANQFLQITGSTTIDATGLSAGTGTIRLSGGNLQLGGNDRIDDKTTLDVNGVTFDIEAFSDTVGGVTLEQGSITGTTGILTSKTTFQTQSGSIIAILAGNVGVTQSGNGTTILSGANTYSGTTTIAAGTLQIGNGGSTGNLGTGNVVDNGTLAFKPTAASNVANVISGTGGLTIVTGQIDLSGTNTYTGTTLISSGSLLFLGAGSSTGSLSPSSAIIDNGLFGSQRSNTLTQGVDFASVISGSGGVFAAGGLLLNGLNTYTGITTISAGTLTVNSIKNVGGGPSALGAPTSGAGGTIGIGTTGAAPPGLTSKLVYTGTGDTTDRVINLRETAGNFTILDQSGTGLLKFTSSFTATGASAKTLTLQGSTSSPAEIAGTIVNNSPTNTTSLTKTGTGTWTLSGNNTYTGATTVSAGTLLINGSITSNVSVASGATLGGKMAGAGTGTINGTINVASGGHLAPGSNAGILNSGNLTLASGANFDVELNGGTAGSGYDQQNVTGTVDVTGSALNLTLGFTPAVGNSFTIINNDSNDAVTGTFNGLPEGKVFTATTGSFSGTFQITYRGGDGNDVVLTAVSASTPALQGTPGDDKWLVKRNADTTHLDIILNGIIISSPVYASLTSLSISSLAGNDTLTVDSSAGNAFPSGGINFDGGTSTTTGDTLIITGGSEGTVTYDYTSNQAGTVTSDLGKVSYLALEQLTNAGAATDVTFDLPTGPNNATLGDDGTSGNTLSRLSATTIVQTDFANPSSSLTIKRGNAADALTVNSLPDFDAALNVGAAGGEFSAVTFNSSLNLGTDKSLSVSATGTISLPNTTSDLSVSGIGTVTLTTARDINLASGSSITSVDGDILLSANQQPTPTSGTFVGVDVNGSIVRVAGAGEVTIQGMGGDTPFLGANLNGVRVRSSAIVKGGTGGLQLTGIGGGSGQSSANGVSVETLAQLGAAGTGPVNIQGTGGMGSLGANDGVSVSSTVTSDGGIVHVVGRGGVGFSYGVHVGATGMISSGGAGNTIIEGTGDNGVDVADGLITSSGGNVEVTGQGSGTSLRSSGVILNGGTISAGGNGAVAVTGTGGATSDDLNIGVWVDAGTINSSGGNVTVTGQGGGSAGSASNAGVRVQSGQISAGVSGAVSVRGTGGTSSGASNNGVFVGFDNATIASSGGNVEVTGVEGNGSSGTAIFVRTSGSISAAGNGTLTLIANTMSIDSSSTISASATSSVTLRTLSNDTAIDLGLATDSVGGPLALTDEELDRFTAGTINVGDANSGKIIISAAISRSAATVVNLISDGSINFATGSIDTGGGNLTLTPGTSGSVGVASAGTDATVGAGSVSFGSGSDLAIGINGTTVDTDYDQLHVIGTVDLTGVNLVLSGTYTPAGGNTFTIVNNDGPNDVIGEFNGLHDGDVVQIAAGALAGSYRISYHGGDGNDVVISSGNAPPSFTSGGNQTGFDEDAVTHGPANEQVVANWASNVSAGPGESGQTLTFHVDNDNHAIFAVQPTIDADGTLHYTAKPNAHGVATVTVTLQDDGGGTDTSGQQQFTIEIKKLHKLHNAAEIGTRNGLDVTGATSVQPDGHIVAADVLAVINYINAKGSGEIPASVPIGAPYVDVNGDDRVVAQDVLDVINWINAHPGQSEGEAADDSTGASEAAADSSMADLISLIAADIASTDSKRRRV